MEILCPYPVGRTVALIPDLVLHIPGQPCILMPRKGWSDVPTELVQIVRGPRPKSAKWPLAASQSGATRPPTAKGGATSAPHAPVQGRRGSQDGFANPTRQEGRGLPPDEVIAGEGDPVGGRNCCRGRVRSHVCHVEGGIGTRQISSAGASSGTSLLKHTNIFIERAKKRVSSFQEDVKKAQAAVVFAQEKLAQEEVLLRKGEIRFQALQEETNRMECQEVPPTVPCNFARELA